MYGNMAQVAVRVVEPGPNVEGVFEELNMSRFNRNPAVLTCNNFRFRRSGLGDCFVKWYRQSLARRESPYGAFSACVSSAVSGRSACVGQVWQV
jgi:hypothetical protein